MPETMTETQIIVEAMQLLTRQTLRSVTRNVNRGSVFSAQYDAKRLTEQLRVLAVHFDQLW